MALMEIVTWPNPILDTPGDPVTVFNDQLKLLVSDMFETMYAAPGVGLAAVQVGVSKRLFVMDCSGGKYPQQRVTVINPEVLRVEGTQNGDEGCLSFPGIFTPVERNLRAIVHAQAMRAALEKVKSELGREYPLVIGGERITTGNTLDSINPANRTQVVGRFNKPKKELASRAVEEAAKAFETWKQTPPADRASLLFRTAAIMRELKH